MQEWQAGFEFLLLTGDGHTHGARHALHHRIGIDAGLLAQTGKLLEAGTEDLLDAGVRVRIATGLAVQLGQVDARPEAFFESIQCLLGGAHGIAALENHDPGCDRGGHEVSMTSCTTILALLIRLHMEVWSTTFGSTLISC